MSTGPGYADLAPLLARPLDPERIDPRGFLDLLDGREEEEPARRPVSQGLFMESPAVSGIYNKVWRPAWFTLAARQAVNIDEQAVLIRRFLDRSGPVVDLSCGPGTFTGHLWREEALRPVIGLDLSASMLEEAARSAPGPLYVRGDATALPFAGDTLAAIANAGAFHFYPEPAVVLREVHRVLRPGGCYVLLAFVTLMGSLAKITRPVERSVAITRYTVAEIRDMLAYAGFTDVEHVRFAGQAIFRAVKATT